jgi:hypothetical protein
MLPVKAGAHVSTSLMIGILPEFFIPDCPNIILIITG